MIQGQVTVALTEAGELFDDCSVTLRGVPRGELRHAKDVKTGKKAINAWSKSCDLAVSMMKLMEKV